MMPHDLPLACITNREPFDAVIDMHYGREHSPKQLRIIQAARDICGSCDYRLRCLAEFSEGAGIIAGLTEGERARLRGRVA